MLVQMNQAESRRFVWAVLLAVLIASSGIVFADDVYIDTRGFRKWCENASNWAYIVSGCWRY